jgi:hypothetical protein
MMRWRAIFLRCALALVVFVVVLELALRLLTREVEGHPTLFRIKLLPFERLTARHAELLAKDDRAQAYVIPDAMLGWTIKPQGRSEDGMYVADAQGFRCGAGASSAAANAKLVLLAGDSFTHGDELPYEHTWAAQLATELGNDWRVRNAGVPGYGTDQALLRAEALRATVRADVAVLTLCRDDLLRNVNVLRSAYLHWTDMPWTKPRFVLQSDGKLELHNQPTVPPSAVADMVRHYDDAAQSRIDAVYCRGFYESPWTDASRLLRWLRSRKEHRERYEKTLRLSQSGGEGVLVSSAIVRRFVAGSRAAGIKPVVMLLPQADDITRYRSGTPSVWQPLLDELAGEDCVMDLGPALIQALNSAESTEALFVNGVGHPNQRASALIARALAARIRAPH